MRNILLVEDEEALLNILGIVLRDEGYEVKKSLDAEGALRLCESHQPDMIICDVKLGEMDGFAMLEQLKATEKFKNIPFIFLTGLDDTEGKKKGLRLGAQAYITKPFDVYELLEKVRNLVPPT
ncbi:MAG: response regulator [Ignavibacteria bacterium]|nr:response regulator [Ignavibacteria bacterium]